MKTQRTLLMLSLVVFASALAIADPDASGKPKMTKDQVIAAAMDFCKAEGITGSTLSQVSDPVAEERHFLPRWHVSLRAQQGAVDVKVDDSSGEVTDFFRPKDKSGPQGLSNPIPQQEAIDNATQALTAAHVLPSTELSEPKAFYYKIADDDAFWLVSWQRVFNGLPYRYQHVNVTVNAADGNVSGLGVTFSTPAPTANAENYSSDQAQAIAAQMLAAAGLTPTAAPTVKDEVVQPNGLWKPGDGDENDTLPVARVAWIVTFPVGERSYSVWVDKATGAVLGGENTGPR